MSNPWLDLDRDRFVRVDASHKWEFFWAKSSQDKPALVLQVSNDVGSKVSLPSLRGVDCWLENTVSQSGRDRQLVFELLETEHIDIFRELCLSIVESARDAEMEQEAVDRAARRTWRWHHLLRRQGPGSLSVEQQRGLIGELWVIKSLLLEAVSADEAIRAWVAPLSDTPKDFEIAGGCIEAKTRRGANSPFVLINSEDQLDGSDITFLYLHVLALNDAQGDSSSSFTLKKVADDLSKRLQTEDMGVLEEYERRLFAAGFDPEYDYTNQFSVAEDPQIFCVQDEFPKITRKNTEPALSNVVYRLNLQACRSFLISRDELISFFNELNHE